MRALLAIAAVLLLTSCFGVSDINGYWEKAYVDTALQGNWQYVDEKPYDKAKKWRFTLDKDDNLYKVDGFMADTGLANNRPVDMRTLKIGKYTYALAKVDKQEWILMRYDVKGKNAHEILPNNEALIAWIKEHNPGLKSVEITEESPQDIKITKLDDEAFQLLSALPDGDEYWNSFWGCPR